MHGYVTLVDPVVNIYNAVNNFSFVIRGLSGGFPASAKTFMLTMFGCSLGIFFKIGCIYNSDELYTFKFHAMFFDLDPFSRSQERKDSK